MECGLGRVFFKNHRSRRFGVVIRLLIVVGSNQLNRWQSELSHLRPSPCQLITDVLDSIFRDKDGVVEDVDSEVRC